MKLHEYIMNFININKSLIRQYFSKIIVNYYDDEENCLTIEESISDLIYGRNNFAIDISEMDDISIRTMNNAIYVDVN